MGVEGSLMFQRTVHTQQCVSSNRFFYAKKAATHRSLDGFN